MEPIPGDVELNASTDDAAADGAAGPAPLPRFAVVDIETSGLSPRRHRVLQVAVVMFLPEKAGLPLDPARDGRRG